MSRSACDKDDPAIYRRCGWADLQEGFLHLVLRQRGCDTIPTTILFYFQSVRLDCVGLKTGKWGPNAEAVRSCTANSGLCRVLYFVPLGMDPFAAAP